MRELNPGMLKEFGLTAKRVSREFGAYLCETDQGLYLVKSADDSEREMLFAHRVKEHLQEKGFEDTDRYCLTQEGQPWTLANREVLTVRRWIRGEEMDLAKAEDCRSLAKALAGMHCCCTGLELPEEPAVIPHYNDWPGRMERQMRRIRSLGKNIRRRGRMEEFDLLFLKALRTYEEDGQEAIAGLAGGCMDQVSERARQQRAFCHAQFSNHSVLFAKNKCLIHDFEGAQLAPPIMDLARLLEKALRKNKWNASCAKALLASYESERELSKEEKEVLYYYLLYPQRAWELAGEGYDRRSQWVPAVYRTKLEIFTELAEERRECLETMRILLLN